MVILFYSIDYTLCIRVSIKLTQLSCIGGSVGRAPDYNSGVYVFQCFYLYFTILFRLLCFSLMYIHESHPRQLINFS